MDRVNCRSSDGDLNGLRAVWIAGPRFHAGACARCGRIVQTAGISSCKDTSSCKTERAKRYVHATTNIFEAPRLDVGVGAAGHWYFLGFVPAIALPFRAALQLPLRCAGGRTAAGIGAPLGRSADYSWRGSGRVAHARSVGTSAADGGLSRSGPTIHRGHRAGRCAVLSQDIQVRLGHQLVCRDAGRAAGHGDLRSASGGRRAGFEPDPYDEGNDYRDRCAANPDVGIWGNY